METEMSLDDIVIGSVTPYGELCAFAKLSALFKTWPQSVQYKGRTYVYDNMRPIPSGMAGAYSSYACYTEKRV